MLQSFLLVQLHNLIWEVLLHCVREVIKCWQLVNHLNTLLRCRCWFNRSGARPSLCISSKFSGNADVLVQGPHFENGVPIYIYRRANIYLYIYACVCVLSCYTCVWLFATLWTVTHQAPLSTVFSRHQCWSGLPCPPPEDLPDPGIAFVSHYVSGFGRWVLYH